MEANTNYAYLEAHFSELCSSIVQTLDKKLTKKLGEDKPPPILWDWKWTWNQVILSDSIPSQADRKEHLEVLKNTDPASYVQNLMEHNEISFTLTASLRHVKFPKGLEETLNSTFPKNATIPQEIIKHYTPDSFGWKGTSVFIYNQKSNKLEEHAVLGALVKGDDVEVVLLNVQNEALSVNKNGDALKLNRNLGVLPFQDLVSQKDNRSFREYKIVNSQKALEALGEQKDWILAKSAELGVSSSIPNDCERTYLKPNNVKKLKI